MAKSNYKQDVLQNSRGIKAFSKSLGSVCSKMIQADGYEFLDPKTEEVKKVKLTPIQKKMLKAIKNKKDNSAYEYAKKNVHTYKGNGNFSHHYVLQFCNKKEHQEEFELQNWM
jgi:hypothetical protein